MNKKFNIIYEGKQYKGFTVMAPKGDYAAIYPEIWAGISDINPISLSPAGIQRSSPNFWNCIFENKSDGSPVQMMLDI